MWKAFPWTSPSPKSLDLKPPLPPHKYPRSPPATGAGRVKRSDPWPLSQQRPQSAQRGPAGLAARPARAPSSRLPFSLLATSGLLQRGPDRAAAALRDALAPRMHTSAGPHTCGAATKFPRAACAGNWGALRPDSEQLPGPAPLHVPPPRPGPEEPSGGGEETGEELPRAAAPPRPLPSSRKRRLPPRRGPPARSPRCRLWRPPSWPAALPRDRLPSALSQWEVRRRLAPSPGLPALLPSGWKGEAGRERAGERKGGPGEHPKGTSSLKRAAAEVALRTKELTHGLHSLRPSPVSIAGVTQTLTVPLRTHLESRPPKLSRPRPALQAPACKSIKVPGSCQTLLHLLLSLQQSSSMLPVPRQSLKGKDLMLSKKSLCQLRLQEEEQCQV
ncbi:PREDICTED: vegetative cell wall protein gp1 [Colobus angolensis palliatus]|uniref:vegetative cell wall protein gp1 n=1 Tax=Colobus angolensis palliatus TaxID=336983 RepID=UPI0005F416AF|nr:PREDICTED: vegetative cell wall protein gp1 [Colobus angolensis palliatus]